MQNGQGEKDELQDGKAKNDCDGKPKEKYLTF